MPLNDTTIRALKPKDKPYKVSDFEGLYLTVAPTGSRLWHLKYRIEGREKRLSFGAYPHVTLAQARKLKDQAKAVLAAGNDPGELKQEKKQAARDGEAQTFSTIAASFKERAQKEGKALATQTKTEWLLDMANADFGNKQMAEINPAMILGCLRKVEAKGNYETARRLRARIGAVFRYAIATGLAETDPTYALRDALIRPKVTSRAAITDANALGGLMRAIDGFHGQVTTKIALQLMALLAQRPGELRAAKWAEFDKDAAIWSIPAERMKMRRPHRVPLPKQALIWLDELRQFTGNGELLFPSLVSHLYTTWFMPVDPTYLVTFVDWVTFLRSDKLFGNDDALFPKPEMAVQNGAFTVTGLAREPYANATAIREAVKSAFTSAGLPAFGPHSFRKTLVKHGDQICKIREEFKAWSQNIGHDSVVTSISAYCPVSSERQAELIRQLATV